MSVRVRLAAAGYTLTAVVFLAGCSAVVSSPPDANLAGESAVAVPSPLTRPLHTDEPLSGRSAFYPLSLPTDAFAARLYLVDHAAERLDVQYYIYEDDRTGNYFAARLLAAANRGVKVRILIDDLVSTGKDKTWKMLAAHPNIELRLFNPNRFRHFFRYAALIFNAERLGKRMHNKALVADGQAAIIGGRNIGDVYFAADHDSFFIDYDILCIGRAVPEIAGMFDRYWNSPQSVDQRYVLDADISPTDLTDAYRTLRDRTERFEHGEAFAAVRQSPFAQKLDKGTLQLTVAPAAFYYDDPAKVHSNENDTRTHLSSRLGKNVNDVERELILITPYFIPSEAMIREFRRLRSKNVRIVVITNSLASTDVAIVYSGYIKRIKALLDTGVELYEIGPKSFSRRHASKAWVKSHKTSLHTKMIVFDGQRLGIGSANLDPRSFKLNTETFMIVYSPALAQNQRAALLRIGCDDLYRLRWKPLPYDPLYGFERSGPVWTKACSGVETLFYNPPEAGFWRTLGMHLMTYLPIDGYL